MTVASALTALNQDITAARTEIIAKGGTVTSGGGSSQLATDIATIPSNTGKERLFKGNFWVDTDGNVHNIGEDSSGNSLGANNGILSFDATSINMDYAYSYDFTPYAVEKNKCKKIDLSSLTEIIGQEAFAHCLNCANLTEVDLSSLKTLNGYWVFQQTFRQAVELIEIRFSSLTDISSNEVFDGAFYGCIKLTDVYFNSLATSSFGSYINQFSGMLDNTFSAVTHTIHFPSNLQSKISTLTGYPNFGGTSGYVVLAFDLPATS